MVDCEEWIRVLLQGSTSIAISLSVLGLALSGLLVSAAVIDFTVFIVNKVKDKWNET